MKQLLLSSVQSWYLPLIPNHAFNSYLPIIFKTLGTAEVSLTAHHYW